MPVLEGIGTWRYFCDAVTVPVFESSCCQDCRLRGSTGLTPDGHWPGVERPGEHPIRVVDPRNRFQEARDFHGLCVRRVGRLETRPGTDHGIQSPGAAPARVQR